MGLRFNNQLIQNQNQYWNEFLFARSCLIVHSLSKGNAASHIKMQNESTTPLIPFYRQQNLSRKVKCCKRQTVLLCSDTEQTFHLSYSCSLLSLAGKEQQNRVRPLALTSSTCSNRLQHILRHTCTIPETSWTEHVCNAEIMHSRTLHWKGPKPSKVWESRRQFCAILHYKIQPHASFHLNARTCLSRQCEHEQIRTSRSDARTLCLHLHTCIKGIVQKHWWMLCSEWVPSEWESDKNTVIHTSPAHH